jgi:hypothetical protein
MMPMPETRRTTTDEHALMGVQEEWRLQAVVC